MLWRQKQKVLIWERRRNDETQRVSGMSTLFKSLLTAKMLLELCVTCFLLGGEEEGRDKPRLELPALFLKSKSAWKVIFVAMQKLMDTARVLVDLAVPINWRIIFWFCRFCYANTRSFHGFCKLLKKRIKGYSLGISKEENEEYISFYLGVSVWNMLKLRQKA